MKNFALRTISGLGFLVVMVAGLLIDKFVFAGLVIFIMCVMMSEFYTITMGGSYRFSRFLAILSGIIFFSLLFMRQAFNLNDSFIALAVLPIILVMINSLYVKDKSEFGKFSNLYTGILYIAIPLALVNVIAFRDGEFSGLMILCFFIIIWCSDVGAFVLGVTLGQKFGKKLFPSISPKKSWIGFWGGMLFALLASACLWWAGILEFPLYHCLILAVIMDIAGVYGDLFESQWKRYYDVKDSGKILPGHGGLLDRFDSALMAIPAGAMYLSVLKLI